MGIKYTLFCEKLLTKIRCVIKFMSRERRAIGMPRDKIMSVLEKHRMDTVGFIPIESCRVTMERRLSDLPEGTKSVIVIAIPYRMNDKGNISAYAAPMDYHYFVSELEKTLIKDLRELFEGEDFVILADKSPIDERDAAMRAGIGCIGKNSLLITEKYSSYVFIAEIYTTLEIPSTEKEISFCEGCGACLDACPSKDFCLSAITQKKGALSKKEADLIRSTGVISGCDICQEVCPHSVCAADTPIEFFRQNRTPYITKELLFNMSDEEFGKRAYSWRGRKTIDRNLDIMETKKVLFIGNSYTFYNDLPVLFKSLASENGFECDVDSVTRGGYWLTQHADLSDECGKRADELLSGKKYDFVILQDNSMATVKDPERFMRGVSELCEKIKKNGAKTVLYQTWGRKEGSPILNDISMTSEEMSLAVENGYKNAEEQFSAMRSPVGKYFRELSRCSDIELYNNDKSHPSFAGSYLAACVFFFTMFGIKPLYPAKEAKENLSEEEEKLLREYVK